MSASKRAFAARLLKVGLESGDARAITVKPDERAKTVHDWLVGQLEPDVKPGEDAALGALTIQRDEAYEAPLERDTTLDDLGLFVNGSGTIVLKVSAVMNESVQALRWRDPYGALFRRILREDWGQRVADGGLQAIEARNQAIRDAIKEKGKEGVEEQLLYVKSRARGSPARWVVELDQDEPTYKIGMDIRMTVRCVDAIGLSADGIGDTELSVEVASVPAKPSSAFTFKMQLRGDDLTGSDAASLAWLGRTILCLPKEQPRGREQAFTLTVTDSAGRTGTSGKFYIEEEATMGDASNTPEIDATLMFKWWDETVNKAPLRDRKIASGRGVDVYMHPSEPGQVLRELREFPPSQKAVREFFKDLTVWQLVGGRCGGKVAQMTNGLGWYFDRQQLRAGFCMRWYDRGSLDEELTPKMKMSDRFDLCDQVLEIMATLDGEFPKLMFPDIKPKNFLCQSQTGGALRIVLTDLDDVRRVGVRDVTTSTPPYRHPGWDGGAPTKKLYEQYAVAVTLLQILLGMRSDREWSPATYVEGTFKGGFSWITKDDIELDRLREHCSLVLTHIGAFFTSGPGSLDWEEAEEGEERESRYSQMLKSMRQLAGEEKRFRALPATSRGSAGQSSLFIEWPPGSQPVPYTTELWQNRLNSMIGSWEADLGDMTSFKGVYLPDLELLKTELKKLKRAVGGEQANVLDRADILGKMRGVVEAVLTHLARQMRKDPRFNPATLTHVDQTTKRTRYWPNVVLDQLKSEMRAPSSERKLDAFYHRKHPETEAFRRWVVPYDTNIERLWRNLKDLRDESHKGHHTADVPDGFFDHNEVHSRMEMLGLLFKTTQRPFVERRMLL